MKGVERYRPWYLIIFEPSACPFYAQQKGYCLSICWSISRMLESVWPSGKYRRVSGASLSRHLATDWELCLESLKIPSMNISIVHGSYALQYSRVLALCQFLLELSCLSGKYTVHSHINIEQCCQVWLYYSWMHLWSKKLKFIHHNIIWCIMRVGVCTYVCIH